MTFGCPQAHRQVLLGSAEVALNVGYRTGGAHKQRIDRNLVEISREEIYMHGKKSSCVVMVRCVWM